MKISSGLNLIWKFDSTRHRVDLQRPLMHLAALALAVWWASLDAAGWKEWLIRTILVGILIIVIRLLLSGLGASRLGAMAVVTTVIALCSDWQSADVMLLDIYLLLLLLLQEYFVERSKFVAFTAALIAAALIGVAEHHALALTVLFITTLFLRFLWHAIFERMGRRAFALFGTKILVMTAMVLTLSPLVDHLVTWSLPLPASLPDMTLALPLAVMIVLLALWGLWATLLLKTERSPLHRGLRIFYLGLAGSFIGVMGLLQRFGERIFTPEALNRLQQAGLNDWSLTATTCALLTVGLCVTASIDRSLYKYSRLGRTLGRFIDRLLPPQQVSSDE